MTFTEENISIGELVDENYWLECADEFSTIDKVVQTHGIEDDRTANYYFHLREAQVCGFQHRTEKLTKVLELNDQFYGSVGYPLLSEERYKKAINELFILHRELNYIAD